MALDLLSALALLATFCQHGRYAEIVMRCAALAVMLLISPGSAAAGSDLAVAVAGMLAAEQQCSGIALDHARIDRLVAAETAKDRSFEYCVRDGCLKGALALLRALPADEKASACAGWTKTIGDAGYMLHH